MPGKSLEVNINPAIIRWARKSAGWNIEDIAKKLGISRENYEKIEAGEKIPTFRQLEILASCFKRSLAVFFLPEPPEEPSLKASFRILPKREQQLSKGLRLGIRKARYYQSVANELMKGLQIDYKPKVTLVKISDNPIETAQEERGKTGIGIDEQFRCHHAYEAFNAWRSVIEQRNILVFQFKFPIEDARGFSLMDKDPPVIGINTSDNILAKTFTLIHEYAHLLLGIPEIYAGEEEISANNLEVENWCSRFASEFLIPEEALRKDIDFQDFIKSQQLSSEIQENLSKKFKVSKHAILTKLRVLNLMEQGDYNRKLILLKQEALTSEKGRFITPPQKCIQEKGKQFISLALHSKERELITTADLIEYLSIKLKHLNRIEELAAK